MNRIFISKAQSSSPLSSCAPLFLLFFLKSSLCSLPSRLLSFLLFLLPFSPRFSPSSLSPFFPPSFYYFLPPSFPSFLFIIICEIPE